MSLSLAIIVKNGEKTIGRCLETHKDIVDEIIVVDTGSTDRTVKIVKKYTPTVHYFKWCNDFSAARNFAFSLCTKEFIIWADADDYILPEDAQKIEELDFSDKEIIICKYEYAHDEFGASICTVPRERIIKRSLGLQWQERIHEYLPITAKTYISDIHTHHDKQHGTSERNLAMLEEIVKENPDNARNLYYLGKEYADFGRTEDAIKYLSLFIDNPDGYWEDKYNAHSRIAQCYQALKNDDKFLSHMLESIKIESRRAEPFFFIGQHYMNQSQWDKAIQWFEFSLAVRRSKDLLATFQPEYYTWLPCLQLCVCYNSIGDIQKAYDYNKKVLEYRPKDSRAINNDKILSNALKSKADAPKVEEKKSEIEHKNVKGPSVAWIAPENWGAAQTRIRVLNVNRSLQMAGYQSKVTNSYDEAMNYDIIIVGKAFDEGTYNNIKRLKEAKKIVYADICESLFEFPWFKEILGLCDKVICCSYKLEEQVKTVNQNTAVIEDAWESPDLNEEIWSVSQFYKIQQKKSEFLWFLDKIRTIKDYRGIGVDIGTYDGGSSAGLSYICKELTTIDINPIRFNPNFNPGCLYNYIQGDSKAPETKWKLRVQLDGNYWNSKEKDNSGNAGKLLDFLFIDGDHMYPGAKSDFETYKEFVKPGGLIAFHDIAKHPNGWSEMDILWKELKPSYNTEEFIDSPQDWGGIGLIWI